MIKSMTGYGKGEYADSKISMTVEIKSVNHRYLDISLRMPKKLSAYETKIRDMLKEKIQRGKVDVSISFEYLSEEQTGLKYNENLASQYLTYLRKMSRTFMIEDDIRCSTLARFPEVFTMEDAEDNYGKVEGALKEALTSACSQFVETRKTEGEHLKRDILKKLDGMKAYISAIEKREPEMMRNYREKLETKVKELLDDTNIDEARIATEIVLYSDKICTDEEVVRLKSHMTHMRETMEKDESIGRKLDFIAQEMNREANTILSKANDITISNQAIDLKTDIEKIREQLQNIE